MYRFRLQNFIKKQTLFWVGMLTLGILSYLMIVSTSSLWAVPTIQNSQSSENLDRVQPKPAAIGKPPVLLGLYTNGYAGAQNIIDRELHQVDEWATKKHAIVGMFMDIQGDNPSYNIGHRLEILRDNGYTAFINLKSTRLASEIARGDLDNDLRKVASAVADWTKKGEGRMMFIAPLQEMNIAGESYSLDPENFKLSYKRIQQIFSEFDMPTKSVRWVFSPNGFSRVRNQDFENYYPQDAQVDILGFSGYNWGYCSSPLNQRNLWDRPESAYGVYIKRMQKLAPNKPIFITQIASSSYNKPHNSSGAAKQKWLYDSYQYLAAAPSVQAIIYFNIEKECDWALDTENQNLTESYPSIVANQVFGYVAPRDMLEVVNSLTDVSESRPNKPIQKVVN